MIGGEPQVGDRLGRYLLVEVLGRGGMGAVFRARDEQLERDVAVKVIHPALAAEGEFRDRFRREAVLLSQMDSAHVVSVYDHGEQDGAPYLVTQLVRGGDLMGLVRARGALPPAQAVDLAGQVLSGLADAHAAGVVHRDVKPSNVLLTPDTRTAYLCDFGIATSPGSEITRTGAIVGSTAYMAPERHRGETAGEAGVASDVYAAGCLLWQLLTGSQPYVGTEGEIAMGHLAGPIPQLPGGSPLADGLNTVLRHSMAKEPAERYRSARAMAHELAALTADTAAGLALPEVTAIRQPVLSASAPAPAAAPRSPWRRVLTTAVVVALVATGVYVGSRLTGTPVLPSVLASDPASSSPSASADPGGTASSDTAAGADPSSAASPSAPGAGVATEAVPPPAAEDGGDPGSVAAPGAGSAGGAGGVPSARPSSRATPRAPSSTAPAAPAAPAAPTARYRCWNGSKAVKLSSCSLPTGRSGANWVFAGFGGLNDCRRLSSLGSGFIEGFECSTSTASGRRVLVASRWRTPSPACDYYYSRYDKGTRARNAWVVGGQPYGRAQYGRVGKLYHSSRIYIGNGTNAWALAAYASTDAGRDAMLAKVRFRAPGQFRGVPLG